MRRGDSRPACCRAKPLAVAFALLLAGCGNAQPPQPAQARPFVDPGFVVAGEVRLDYALTLTNDLPSEIAASYGIEQRPNLALLTITLAANRAPGATRLVASRLAATAIELTGKQRALSLIRHDEPGGPTYLATVSIRHREPITIEIRAQAIPSGPEIASRWTRQFHIE